MTRTVNQLIIIYVLLAADPGGLFAQEQWKSVSDDNGVAIYSRKVAGHEVSEFKGITHINQPIEVIGAVLAEIPDYTEWFFKCQQARPAEPGILWHQSQDIGCSSSIGYFFGLMEKGITKQKRITGIKGWGVFGLLQVEMLLPAHLKRRVFGYRRIDNAYQAV